MQRSFLSSAVAATSATSAAPTVSTRSITTQTGPAPAQRTRQTQTEPHLCLDCHTAQLVELLRPGRLGRAPSSRQDFVGGPLSTITEEDEAGEPAAAEKSGAQVLAESLLDPHGLPLRHARLDPELLRVVLKLPNQSLGGRTAE